VLSHPLNQAVVRRGGFANYVANIQMNCSSGRLRLQHKSQQFRSSGELVQNPLPVALFVTSGARISVLHRMPQCVDHH